MSEFISDQELEVFVRDVLMEEPRRKETAQRLSDAIAARKVYEDRSRCDCEVNCCQCYLPLVLDPGRIQAGDVFEHVMPRPGFAPRVLTLGALGVRTRSDGGLDIFTAGWPPGVVRFPEAGDAVLKRKGRGITRAQLKHRREHVGDGWDDGL